MNCICKVTSVSQVLLSIFVLESVMLHWSYALVKNTASDSIGDNENKLAALENILEASNNLTVISTNFDNVNEKGNYEYQDDIADLLDNYSEFMSYGDTKRQNTEFKRAIKEQREKRKRNKLLKDENVNPNSDSGDSLLGAIIEHPERIHGPLKNLISKYSEANRQMYNKHNRNGFRSLKSDIKTNNKTMLSKNNEHISDNKNKFNHNQNVNKGGHLHGSSDIADALRSVQKSDDDEEKIGSKSGKYQSIPNNSNEVKSKFKSRIVHTDEEVKAKLINNKKGHNIKGVGEDNLDVVVKNQRISSEKQMNDEDIRRNYINSLIKIKPIGDFNGSQSEKERYANMSLINEGFLNAVEKKYFSMNNGAFAKLKPKTSIDFGLNITKPENTDSQIPNNWVFNKNGNEEVTYSTQSSLKSNGMVNNKKYSDKKLNRDNLKLSNTHKNKAIKTKTESKNSQDIPIESSILSIIEDTKKDKNSDKHPRYESEMESNKILLKNPAPTTVQSTEEKHIHELKDNEKWNKKRSHRKVAAGNFSKNLDSLDSGMRDGKSAMKKNNLRKRKDHSKRRHERDVENKNLKPRKYRIDVDSRGRSRLMISDTDDNNNSGSLNIRSEGNERSGDKGKVMMQNNLKQDQFQYVKESYDENPEEEVNYMEGYDDYDDEHTNNFDNDEDADVKKVFARRAHHPRYNDAETSVTEYCVDYKGEKVSSKTLGSTSLSSVATERTSKQASTIKRNVKEKSTPRTNGRSQTSKSKSTQGETIDNATSDRDADEYEQFLTGQFVDSFVNAVLTKVQRSRKMAKELGFGNDTDESCDRCLETKLNKMPDLEDLRNPLNNLPKNGQKKNSLLCYKVPKPMDNFLLLLVSTEKEQESSVYRNIQDESSFIFTGDYPESSLEDDQLSGNEKYNDEKSSIGKDMFEKQHLRDEETEDKFSDQISRSPFSRTSNRLQEDETAGNIVSENDGSLFKDKTMKKKNKKVVHKNEKHTISSQGTRLKGNNLANEFDASETSSGSRYDDYAESDNAFNTNNVKHRRHSYKTENIPSAAKADLKFGSDVKDHQNTAATGDLNRLPKLSYDIPNSGSGDGGYIQSIKHDYSIKNRETHNNLAKDYAITTNENTRVNHYAKPNNFYEYPQEGWAKREGDKSLLNADHQYFIPYDGLRSKEEEEYQLYPNLVKDDPPFNTMSGYPYKKNDYGGKMVKRDTELNYENDPVFFEVPDIEYDLY